MFYIVLGAAGFLAIHLFDLVALKRLPLAKPVTWGLGNALLVYATIGVSLSGDTLPLPAWSTWRWMCRWWSSRTGISLAGCSPATGSINSARPCSGRIERVLKPL